MDTAFEEFTNEIYDERGNKLRTERVRVPVAPTVGAYRAAYDALLKAPGNDVVKQYARAVHALLRGRGVGVE